VTEEPLERSGAGRTDLVTLSVPAETRHAATARVVAASLAADLGFDVDEIDDLRLGVNEAVAVVLDVTAGSDGGAHDGDTDTLDITFTIDGTRIGIEVSRSRSSAEVEFDELADRILSAVVDQHSSSAGVVRLSKSLRDAD
jgi:serine/threonine-protein kinase RsbW